MGTVRLRRAVLILAGLLTGSAPAWADPGVPGPSAASGWAQTVHDVQMLTLGMSAVLLVIAFGIALYSLYSHRKGYGEAEERTFRETGLGRWSWVIVPVLVLGVDLAIAGSRTMAFERPGWLAAVEGGTGAPALVHPGLDLTGRVESGPRAPTPDDLQGRRAILGL